MCIASTDIDQVLAVHPKCDHSPDIHQFAGPGRKSIIIIVLQKNSYHDAIFCIILEQQILS